MHDGRGKRGNERPEKRHPEIPQLLTHRFPRQAAGNRGTGKRGKGQGRDVFVRALDGMQQETSPLRRRPFRGVGARSHQAKHVNDERQPENRAAFLCGAACGLILIELCFGPGPYRKVHHKHGEKMRDDGKLRRRKKGAGGRTDHASRTVACVQYQHRGFAVAPLNAHPLHVHRNVPEAHAEPEENKSAPQYPKVRGKRSNRNPRHTDEASPAQHPAAAEFRHQQAAH